MAMAVSSSTVLRVRGLPSNRNIDEVTSLLERSLQIRPEVFGMKITSLAEDPYQVRNQVATLVFLKKPPPLFTTSTTNQWSINVSEADFYSEGDGDQALSFDTHFHGLTALSTPRSKEEAVDCVAVCGLGGHAFGSFKEKGTSYMWLRDSVPKDLPNLRVLLYGYESGLDGSDSNQNISVIADSFIGHLSQLRSQVKPISTPLVIIAHSLGGLVVKQAITKLGHGSELDKKQMESMVGLLFFGVPNRGMDIESLQAIVCDGQNRYLLESVGQYSDLLLQQDREFGSTFHFTDSPVVSFYETKSSPTAVKVNNLWKMEGPEKVLVDHFSATRPRLWEPDDEGFHRTHSELVKFSVNDVDYERVLNRLRGIATKATGILTSRYLTQGRQRFFSTISRSPQNESTLIDDEIVIESPKFPNADEEACLQSLSFREIYTRESIIEPAIQDTGSWLLESQDFQDWIQRKRLNEHRGFFWIQGNPGSGKSTLMKKVYSHVKARSQDPLSVIAAFFFNARGNGVEKSPTGLFRTLLHTLCQRVSALRDLVTKAYVAKCRLLGPNWQWQLSELKDFLAAVVTSSVLGPRSLLLFVDALDECDLAATQSVIHMFEDLASSSLSEGTHFSICLSSRYWPQFRIQNCFIARVELKNEGDIVRYIQKRLESTHINEDLKLHAALRTEILDKAKGTFLWVVLVSKELLTATTAGATLRELRNIVQRVPPDLVKFYQHQLKSTENEDRERMLRLLQLVFYAQRPLSPTELRYALAFGCKAYASYAEWSQSSEYVRSDEQMEKRIREHSKGLVEIVSLPMDDEHAPNSPRSRKAVVQLIHQSVRDFLTTDGFSFLRDSRWHTHSADGHEFIKTACLNYFRIKDLESMLTVDFRVSEQFHLRRQVPILEAEHPLLEYMVQYIFPHSAQAEQYGVSQDDFRTNMCSNIQGCFERWRCLYDIICAGWVFNYDFPYGPEARPIHVLAQYGLLTRDIAEKEGNVDIAGGPYRSALVAACWNGHQDAVRILLELGADPRFDATHPSLDVPWTSSMAPFVCAVFKQDLAVLRQLLNDHRSSLTLAERLPLATLIRVEKPHLEALLALLFPEATFPDSAIYDLCKSARQSTLRVFTFLLDKSEESIVHEESVWHSVLSDDSGRCISKIRALLDRGGTLEITEEAVECLHPRHKVADGVLSLLLEHCEAEMTEDLVDSMSRFADSPQIVRTFEAAGYRFDPFTPQQLLRALKYGSVEKAAFFLQRQDGNTSADEMLDSALRNLEDGEQVTRLLLGYLNPDQIDEQATITALENWACGGDLIQLFYSRWSNLTFSEAALVTAVRWQHTNTVRFVLERGECVRVTEELLNAATENHHDTHAAHIIDLLLVRDPDTCVQESTVIGAICRDQEGIEILDLFCSHGKPLVCTENVVAAAVNNQVEGPDILELVLQQDRSARISSSMIMMAMEAERVAALISVMLWHDHTIVIEEEHLIAAASNEYDPRTIFAFLQTKGKLGNANPSSENLNTGPAKRRRVSPKSSPRISTNVINAAFSNPEAAKLRLLNLFVEWGIITAADCNNRICNTHTRPHTPVNLPSISQHFPDL